MLRLAAITALFIGSASTLARAEAPEAGDVSGFAPRQSEIRKKLCSQLVSCGKQAFEQGLTVEVKEVVREALVVQPGDHDAIELAGLVQKSPKSGTSKAPPAEAQISLSQARLALASKLEKARKDAAAHYANLALWCQQNNLTAEYSHCLSETLRLDPDNPEAHQASGEQLLPGFGWVKQDISKKLADGLWLEKGRWTRWSDVSKRRIAELRSREQGKLSGDFRHFATRHLTIASNLSDSQYEKELIAALELCVLDQRDRLLEPCKVGQSQPYSVILFQEYSQYTDYCRRNGGQDAFGFYDPARRTLFSWRMKGNMINGIGTVFHETTHGILQDYYAGGPLPVWLNEGFASFQEKTRPKGNHINYGPINIPRMEELKNLLANNETVTLDELISLDQNSWSRRIKINYNACAMLMHYLWDQGVLPQFLRDYKKSRNPKQSLMKVLKHDFQEIDRQYQSFLREKLLDPRALEIMQEQMAGTSQL